MNEPFRFKEFIVRQDKTAMKVGTDGVLLGAWCSLESKPETILDIGSGTGLISLMMAQRSFAEVIDAVEIDEQAYEQTVENFEESDWGDRLFCYHSSFQEFAAEMKEEEETYDLIISNPPFYQNAYETADESRNKARFTFSLSFENLLEGVSSILSEDGFFSTIIPYTEEEQFIQIAKDNRLNLSRICRVKGNPKSKIKRSLLEFSFQNKEIQETKLVLEHGRHEYTTEYQYLTKDFYLKM